jgi:hypothetical protein
MKGKQKGDKGSEGGNTYENKNRVFRDFNGVK